MLNPKELSTLLSIIAEDEKSLENVSIQFHKTFQKQDVFKVECCLCSLLSEGLIFEITHRMVAYYLLYDSYRTDTLHANPFLQLFIQILKEPNVSQAEKFFVESLANAPSKEFSKKSAKDLTKIVATTPIQTDTLSQSYHNHINIPPLSIQFRGISSILLPPDRSTKTKVLADSECMEELLREGARDFVPPFVRPAPPVYSGFHSEDIKWVTGVSHSFAWDDNMCKGRSNLDALLERASTTPLEQRELQEVTQLMSEASTQALEVALSSDQLVDVIEHNTQVAVGFILQMMSTATIDTYLGALERTQMSLQSMEVVNQLTSTVELPSPFLLRYINNCIDQCQRYKDKFTQQRMVRLVCVFISCLVRNKIIQVKDLTPPSSSVQSFCIEHSKIREAASLFRLLKNLETPNGNGI